MVELQSKKEKEMEMTVALQERGEIRSGSDERLALVQSEEHAALLADSDRETGDRRHNSPPRQEDLQGTFRFHSEASQECAHERQRRGDEESTCVF